MLEPLHSRKVSRPSYFWMASEGPDGYERGWIYLPEGIMEAYRQNDRKGSTRLDFVWKGRQYDRSFPSFLNDRQVVRKAREFVREILAEVGE